MTDNKALTYLEQFKNETSRLTRWALSIQPYVFDVVHRPGQQNGNADGLSRQYDDIQSENKEGEMLGSQPTDP